MDRVLERITRVILHNKNATLNSTSALTSGVYNFKRTLFYRNVYCKFSFMKDNTLPYYTNVDMPSSNSSFNTCSSVYNKLKCFKHALTRDEYCFQYAGTHNWNLLPNNITALNYFANFKLFYTYCNRYV